MKSFARLVLMVCLMAQMAEAHTVALSFAAPVNADQVKVYRGTKAGGPYVVLATLSGQATAYNDANVVNGGLYSYVATAVNSVGESPYSSEVTATIPVDPPPPPQTTATPAILITAPSLLAFSGQSGSPDPAAQSFSIGDSTPAGVHVPFMIGTDQTWLWATPDSFSTNANIAINVKLAGLAAGTYTGNVFVTAPDYAFNGATYTFTNSPVKIPVTLTVAAAPGPPPPPPPAVVTPVSFTWSAGAALKVGTTVQFTAGILYSDGTKKDLTNLVTWTSSSTTRLSFSGNGLATVKTAGKVTVTATLDAKTQVTTTK